MKQKSQRALTLKALTKSNVWDLQENDIFRMWAAAEKDADLKDNKRHYLDIIRSAFNLEPLKISNSDVISKYEARGYKVGTINTGDTDKTKWAIKKKPILRVTDLTYENIRHISAAKLIEVLERNFGGGWESLSQSIQDIIQSGFDISTTTLPAERLKRPGGMYEQKLNDGYEVLEIPKGSWVEAIFAKEKPETEKPHLKIEDAPKPNNADEDGNDDDDLVDNDDSYNDDEDEFDDDKLTEESYLTTFDENPEDLDLVADDVADDEEDY